MSRSLGLRSAALVVAISALLSGCTAPPAAAPETSIPATLTVADLEVLAPVDVVDALEALPPAARPTDYTVSVRPAALLVTDADGERELPLPDDVFYLSVAPYVDSTHECFFHSLTTCLGEMADEELTVTVVADDGEVLVDEARRTSANGFLGLWLPRDVRGTLTMASEGRTASTAFGTGDDDPTCLTTLQLT